jgi:hypothetical protein
MFTPTMSSLMLTSQLPSQSPTHGVGTEVLVGLGEGVMGSGVAGVAVAVACGTTVRVAVLASVRVLGCDSVGVLACVRVTDAVGVDVAVALAALVSVGEGATHWLASSSQMPTAHGSPPLVHEPFWHVSVPEQNRPSSVQGVPFGMNSSGGQPGLLPSQLSAASHSPGAGRHSVPDGLGSCVQVPVVLQTSSVHPWSSAGHGLPSVSY